MLMHGDGKSLWFDKSVTLITFPNGKAGLMCEHSCADALTNAHMWEWLMSGEAMHGHLTGPDTNTKGYNKCTVDQSINAAYKHNLEPIANLELTMVELEEWGKGFVEKARCRPDALAQLAMQLA
mmetsp:Transcript_28273/g.67265  ORF Transcript_28273/g.67265 Transcript_28273/m.67265 type:complete len:124 (-) Transcript_28273:717-1088(-)